MEVDRDLDLKLVVDSTAFLKSETSSDGFIFSLGEAFPEARPVFAAASEGRSVVSEERSDLPRDFE